MAVEDKMKIEMKRDMQRTYNKKTKNKERRDREIESNV